MTRLDRRFDELETRELFEETGGLEQDFFGEDMRGFQKKIEDLLRDGLS